MSSEALNNWNNPNFLNVLNGVKRLNALNKIYLKS